MKKLLAVFAALALIVGGCVTQTAFESKDPLVRYYGALADYNNAKRVALTFVELPSTTKKEADAVVRAVARGDAAVQSAEKAREQCRVEAIDKADDTIAPEATLDFTSDELHAIFEAVLIAAFADCVDDSQLATIARVLQAVANELRVRVQEEN